MALLEPRRAGQVLREGPRGAPEAQPAVPALERQGQLQIRAQEEEEEEGEAGRPRLIILPFSIIFAVALAVAPGAGQVLRDGAPGEAAAHADVPRVVGQGQLRQAQEEEEEEGRRQRRRRRFEVLGALWEHFLGFATFGTFLLDAFRALLGQS